MTVKFPRCTPSNLKLYLVYWRRHACMRAYFNTALFRSDQLALQDKIYGITGITPYSVTCMHKWFLWLYITTFIVHLLGSGMLVFNKLRVALNWKNRLIHDILSDATWMKLWENMQLRWYQEGGNFILQPMVWTWVLDQTIVLIVKQNSISG